MDKYTVIYPFKDSKDKDESGTSFEYKVNDIYPREGFKPTKKRLDELSTNKNKLKKILIKKIEETKETTETK